MAHHRRNRRATPQVDDRPQGAEEAGRDGRVGPLQPMTGTERGTGDDHTDSPAAEQRVNAFLAEATPAFAWRITFTFPLVSQARHICFLVNANKNVALLEKVLQGDQQYPAAQVEATNGGLTWILGES